MESRRYFPCALQASSGWRAGSCAACSPVVASFQRRVPCRLILIGQDIVVELTEKRKCWRPQCPKRWSGIVEIQSSDRSPSRIVRRARERVRRSPDSSDERVTCRRILLPATPRARVIVLQLHKLYDLLDRLRLHASSRHLVSSLIECGLGGGYSS